MSIQRRRIRGAVGGGTFNGVWHRPWDSGSISGPGGSTVSFNAVSNAQTDPNAVGQADWTVGLVPTSIAFTFVDPSFTQNHTFSVTIKASDGSAVGAIGSTTYACVSGVSQTITAAISALPGGTYLKNAVFSSGVPNVSNIVVTEAAAAGASLAATLVVSSNVSMFVPLPGAIYANLFVRSTMPLPGSGGMVNGPFNGFRLIPDRGADRTIATSVRTEKFNGNYEQNRVEGINSVSESWSLAFTLRKRAEIELIDALFTSLNGRTSFPWTTPLNELKNFKCVNWDSTYYFDGNASLTCTLEQTFP